MKKLLVFLAVMALAVPALADLSSPTDRIGTPVYTAVATDMGARGTGAGPAVYDSLAGPYAWALQNTHAPTSGVYNAVGWDDYDTTSGTVLTAVKVAGGVTAATGVLWFEFYTYTSFTTGSSPAGVAFATSFGVHFNTPGNYIWTIHANSAPLITIPHTGILQITANPSTVGTWYTTSTAPAVGSNNPDHGGYEGTPFAFSFHVPEPATMILLAAGLLVLRRR